MRRGAGLVVLALAAAACGGGGPGARSPEGAGRDLTSAVVAAMREEAQGDPARAIDLWVRALDAAVAAPESPWQLAVEEAALDALVLRSVASLEDASPDSALVYRSFDATFSAAAGKAPPAGSIEARLAAIAAKADDPFSAGAIARALDDVTTHRGDAERASTWRAASGCASAATIVGPLSWAAVTGVDDPDPLAPGDARLEASYSRAGAFATPAAPTLTSGRGCAIALELSGVPRGVRDVVVDVAVDRPQSIGVSLRAHGAATLRAGGKLVIERPYALGGDEAARFARVEVPRAGTLRLVARVGMDDEDESVEIDVWDEHGKTLPSRAPRPGEAANVLVGSARSSAVFWPEPKSDAERTTVALAALATGEVPTAEQVTEEAIARPDAPPELLLAYARAVEQAGDLDNVHRGERARGAYERILDAWPGAWEAIAAHAVLAGIRRGQTEQRIWTLRDLEERRANANAPPPKSAGAAVLDLFEGTIAGHDRLFDRARAALARARAALPAYTPLLREVDRAATDRAGAERVQFDCAADPGANRGALACFEALRASGDRPAAARELERMRALYGAPQAYLALTLRDALADGDVKRARAAYDAMLPGERTLGARYAVDPGVAARAAIVELAPFVRDAPVALPGLFRASGDDPTAPFAGIAERVAAADRASRILPSAATAVLAHDERYDVSSTGLVHAVLFDVRRVSGTTDVEENAQADPPEIAGRTSLRIVRRRIFKKDGRVLEPERNANAAQAHADLSQLEQGDIIEAIYEGFSLPGETGNVAIDTPDLLPERTAVHEATIELRVPASLHAAIWAHPVLGKASESQGGGARVLRWSMKDAAERRIEEGTPKMDRSVAVSFSTATWGDTARALRETLASLDEHDPEVRAWATAAANGKTAPREIVEEVVAAAGRSVKESEGSALADVSLGPPMGAQQTTARTVLSNHEGSRTWLVVRALRELGVRADVAVAEADPFSADPSFPPHDGRFTHPLAIAHLKDAAGTASDVWIDADVPGPPLPAGRVSPELRGRAALFSDGRVEALPAVAARDERDEVDLRLVVDAKGDAKGSLAILLRGRAAQELAEALSRIVGDERRRMLRGVALAWVPFADVDDVVLSSTEESWQIALRASLAIPGYAQAEGAASGRTWVLPGLDPIHAVYPRPTVATLGATFASKGGRRDALAVSHAMQYHVHRRVELPPGATVVRTPGALEVKDGILAAQRRISVTAAQVEDDYALSVTTGTVNAEDYGAFASDAHRVDDGFLASTRVKPAP